MIGNMQAFAGLKALSWQTIREGCEAYHWAQIVVVRVVDYGSFWVKSWVNSQDRSSRLTRQG